MFPMRRTTFLSLSVVLLIHAGADLSAQRRQDERTLLWEISGNGLAAPSYLYGTMHVYDKRAFDFSDSVLLKLQGCTAFASEVLMDRSLRDVILYYRHQDSIAEAEARMDEEISTEVSQPDMEFVGPFPPSSPADTIGISVAAPDEEPYGGPVRIVESTGSGERPRRSGRISSDLFNEQGERKPGDQPVVLDAYLSRLAKKEGKQMLALEEVGEQLEALSYHDPIALWKFYFSRPKYLRKMTEKQLREMMLRHYRNGDVEKLHTMMLESFPPVMYEKFIVNRNRAMAGRAETYMRAQPTFIAVGAGHLGGEKGLIRLFRERGFTVRPVRATRTGLARSYREPQRRLEWFRFSSETGAYAADLPSEPIDINDFSGFSSSVESVKRSRLYLWVDVLTGITYRIGYYDYPFEPELLTETGNQLGSALNELAYESGKPKGNPKEVRADGLRGVQADAMLADSTIRRSRFYLRGSRIYALSAQTVPELMDSEDAERFFSSFRIEPIRPVEFRPFVSPDGGFRVLLPQEPDTQLDTSRVAFDAYQLGVIGRDSNSGERYEVQCIQYSEVDSFADTAFLFDPLLEFLRYNASDSILRNDSMQWLGFPARDIEVINTRTGYTRRGRALLQGRRLYYLHTGASRERIGSENTEEFFRSFTLLADSASGDLFSDKSGIILSELESENEERRSRATYALSRLDLAPEHIPALHALLRKSSLNDWEAYPVRGAIISKLADMRDTSMVEIIRDIYPEFQDNPNLQSEAFSALAEIRTTGALDLLAELIVADSSALNSGQLDFGTLYPLHYDLPASRQLYPKIFAALNREKYRMELYELTAAMFREGLLSSADILPYASAIQGQLLDLVQAPPDSEDSYEHAQLLHGVIECAGFLPVSAELQSTLSTLQNDENIYIACAATIAAVRQGAELPNGVLARLTASPEISMMLYRGLERSGREALFPAPLRAQRKFAENVFIEWFMEDNDAPPDSVRYLAEREVSVEGGKERAFLFAFRGYPGAAWSVGISGSQPLDRSRLNSTPAMVGSEYAALDADTIDGHFDLLLRQYDTPVREEAMP